MSSPFPLPLNPPLPVHHAHSKPHPFPPLSRPSLPLSLSLSLSKPRLCFSSPSPLNPLNSDPDESLWLREEQRWLREEQRWLREEKRWIREREALITEIQSLKLQIQALERQIAAQGVGDDSLVVAEIVAKVGALVQILTEKNKMITESESIARPIVLEEEKEEKKEVVSVSKLEDKRKALRKGSEGEEVKEMQEALQNLGFYSGEEDVEHSIFSSGTERAVKTWQASVGATEDGIMTAELLEWLYMGQQIEGARSNVNADQNRDTLSNQQKEDANGAAVTSATEISEMQKQTVKGGVTEIEASKLRVFLLGENRWEEPSRLVGRDRQVNGNKTNDVAIKCLSCRGEGHLLCTECDGTGELNVEPQFLEWVDEGAKCPYCEGLGYTVCDVCEGKTIA